MWNSHHESLSSYLAPVRLPRGSLRSPNPSVGLAPRMNATAGGASEPGAHIIRRLELRSRGVLACVHGFQRVGAGGQNGAHQIITRESGFGHCVSLKSAALNDPLA